MKKKRTLFSFLVLSLLALPVITNFEPETESYPSAYPGGLHSFLIWDALMLLYYDSINGSSYYDICRDEIVDFSTKYYDDMYRAQDDYDANLLLQWGHYWDPYDREGFSGNVGAPQHAQDYFEEAVKYYLGQDGYTVDKNEAYYNLGYAIHLMQDLTVPHHAQNNPLGKHTDYETFCFSQYVYRNFTKPQNGIYTPPRDWNGRVNAKGWVHEAAKISARYHRTIENNHYDFDTWLEISQILMEKAIQFTAGFIFHFWQLVQNIDFDNDTLTADVENQYSIDYTNNDTDGDKITDPEEIVVGADGYITNPRKVDSDGDSYDDYSEIYIHHTDPTDPLDSIFYSVPHFCPYFRALSDGIYRLTFSWSQPNNFLDGWYFKVFVLNGNTESYIYMGSVRTFDYNPPDASTFYSYRLYCYKTADNRGIYSQWSCDIFYGNAEERVPG